MTNGRVTTAIHNSPYPNCAPACEYVAIPDGSLSEPPVTNPGPKDLKNSLKEDAKDFLPLGKIMSSSFSTFLPSSISWARVYHINEVIYRICVVTICHIAKS